MSFSQLTPVLCTNELKETIDFYTNILDFTCEEHNDDWGWAILNKGNIELMLSKPNEHTPFDKPTFTGSFYFRVTEIDKLWNVLKEKAKICYELEDFEWGMREFAIYDNNGYTLQFGEEIS